MQRVIIALFLLSLTRATSIHAEMVVHEWGTFTSLVGSDGITQNGMYHEDEALPDFVHDFGETRPVNPGLLCRRGKGCISRSFLERNKITQKMETPVIYFYTDKQQSVSVNVNFPEGVVTETYPAPIKTFPNNLSEPIVGKGNTTFEVEVLPKQNGNLLFVQPENIYSHAREVASNLVVSGEEQEKFIFYRGLGRFQPRISINSIHGNLSLKANQEIDKPEAAFLIHVDQAGHGQMLDATPFFGQVISDGLLGQLSDHSEEPSNNLIMSKVQARAHLIQALINNGLFDDEATAMLNTWENGYLKVPGLRLLYILPSHELEENLALSINPTPESLKRVFVARIEILLDSEEQKILDEVVAQKTSYAWAALGRFAEPMLRRVSQVYTGSDEEVKSAFIELIRQSSLVVNQ